MAFLNILLMIVISSFLLLLSDNHLLEEILKCSPLKTILDRVSEGPNQG